MPATDIELQLTDTFGTWKDKFNQAIGDINTAIDNLPEFNTLAPTNHASTATTYGVGNANNYGHIKLSDATNSTAGVSSGVAATPAAVKTAYDKASTLATSSAAGIVKPGTGMTVDAAGALKVSLNNTVTSTSTTQAATANAVKTAYDKAVEASNKSGLPLGHIYLWPFSTPPDGSIQLNGSEYNRELYSDLWNLVKAKGWYKSESEWQSIASANGGYCPWYSDGDGSTTFRTPKFAPYQKLALASGDAGKYYEAGLPNILGSIETGDMYGSDIFSSSSGSFLNTMEPSGWRTNTQQYTLAGASLQVTFDASRSNPIYGNSTTVQPESHDWIVCVVAFGKATNVGSVDVANVMSAVGQVQAEVSNVTSAVGQVQAEVSNVTSAVGQVQSNPVFQSTAHIVETWKSSNGSSWYRKWSDGFIEQGGINLFGTQANPTTISFATPFTSSNYTVTLGRTNCEDGSIPVIAARGTSYFKGATKEYYSGGYASTHFWVAAGY